MTTTPLQGIEDALNAALSGGAKKPRQGSPTATELIVSSEPAESSEPAATGEKTAEQVALPTEVPGGVTEATPGQTDRVEKALAKAKAAPVEDGKAHAEAVDRDLRACARTVADSMTLFRAIIEKARTEDIWKHLGFKSWTAYVADVIGNEMGQLPAGDRRQVVELLAGEGMSNRAIAEAVGVNEITVRRDKEQVRHDVAPERALHLVRDDQQSRRPWFLHDDQTKPAVAAEKVTGRDGKAYQASAKKAAEADPAEVVLRKAKSLASVMRSYASAIDKLREAYEALDVADRPDIYEVLDPAWHLIDEAWRKL